MNKKIMPARDNADQSAEEICDLDIVVSTRAVFIFQGKMRRILPITTERLFAFWKAADEFKRTKFGTADAMNKSFHAILATVCKEISVKETAMMTVVQRGLVLELIARKVTGQASLEDELKKKVTQGR